LGSGDSGLPREPAFGLGYRVSVGVFGNWSVGLGGTPNI
jgi:hypothetical protein